MMKIKYLNLGFVFVISIFGCKANGISYKEMDSAEKRFNERQLNELAIYMPLEKMFKDVNVRALAKAAGNGNLKKVNNLIDQGVNVNSLGENNATALFWAMRNGNIEGYKKLLELGADSNIVIDDAGTVLHWAVMLENIEYLSFALDYGANPNIVAGPHNHTPLFKAIGSSDYGDMEVVSLLLQHGANINAVNSRGITLAMIAAGIGRFDILYYLLTNGADVSLKDHKGYSLIDDVAEKKNVFKTGSKQEESYNQVVDWMTQNGIEIP